MGATACQLPRSRDFASGLLYTHPKRGPDAPPRVAARVLAYHISKSPSFLLPGCIPVFLLEGEAMPFEETIDWTSSAVRVRREINKLVSKLGWGEHTRGTVQSVLQQA